MSLGRSVSETVTGDGLLEWLPVFLRGVVALILLPAGALKFLNHGAEVTAFAGYGVPAAGLAVVLVGVVELVAGVAILFGAAARLAALVVVPVMLAAMVLYAVVPTNAAVLVASVGILALGAGRHAVWTPEADVLDRTLG